MAFVAQLPSKPPLPSQVQLTRRTPALPGAGVFSFQFSERRPLYHDLPRLYGFDTGLRRCNFSCAIDLSSQAVSIGLRDSCVRYGLGADDLVNREIEGTRCLQYAAMQGAMARRLEGIQGETLGVPVMSWFRLL
jgi:hypothetical protein